MVEIGPADLRLIGQLIQQRTGIVLGSEKKYLVDTRLASLLAEGGFTSFSELLSRLLADPRGPLSDSVIEAMVTSETSFFRDTAPFEALRTRVLPTMLLDREPCQELRVWCAGCSTGQEPYSVAMMILSDFPELASRSAIRILATDLSQRNLERARAGLYSQLEVNRGLSIADLGRYFARSGTSWQIRDDLRRMVEFRWMNLCEPWPALSAMDIVLIRNVMIYFDTEKRKEILCYVRRVLRPGGCLFLGAAETTLRLDDQFKRTGTERCSWYMVKPKTR